MKMRLGLGLLLVLLCMPALAGSSRAVRKQIEASMLVTGSILIERDGSVSTLEVDQRDKLPDVVTTLVEGSGPAWKFEPVLVDGVARRAKARMSLLVVAKKLDDGSYRVGIRSGYFGKEAMTPEERQQEPDAIKPISMQPPNYPMAALEMNARGTVYLVVKVGPEGLVQDVAVEQVNLRTVGSESEMKRMRGTLSRAAVVAARKWSFSVSASEELRQAGFLSVRVPVDYEFFGAKQPGYGEWLAYVPGPREPIPWAQEGQQGADESPEALLAGGLYPLGKGLRLLTPLGGDS
ncbi:hypothetical protein [Pseudoxanthomonas sp. PXM01]|uniref:hypothetical protein n=1 Tax=Pseudoxanthomonas sp. PXM01 TaxID=2769295 RepID=UPI00177D4715|nr:hypothetical protein [Pseudoxanthomonas sp. PXM01]MBD9470608.1 hypothetical protein [Pseudoxanthomonas sp. PXM01]